jgi:hypothetical protein
MPTKKQHDDAPVIRVMCENKDCEYFNKVRETRAGILVGPDVLLTGTLSCTLCGFHLFTVGGGPTRG